MPAPDRFTTLCAAFQHTAAVAPDAVALRTVGDAQTLTWREYATRVRRLAGGLAALGVRHGDGVALLLTNRPEFHLVDAAAMHLGAAPFSVYSTAPPVQINYLLENSACRVLVSERQFLDRARAAGGPVEHIVVVDGPFEGTISLPELETLTPEVFDFEATWRAVEGSDVATLIYTSGTTGNPKGVELTHTNVLAEIAMLDSALGIRRGDRYVSYLPSAHVADRVSAHYVQMVCGTVLTTVDDARGITAALPDVRPHYWFAVPRVWEKIKIAIDAQLAAVPSERAAVVARTMELAHKHVRARQAGLELDVAEQTELTALDAAVLAPIRTRLGFDDLRWAMSGAAAIATETLEFFMALGITIVEAWGMSECGGVGIANPPGRVKVGTVGVPMPGVGLRVAEDGEMLLRGPVVMRGYRNDPVRTAEAFTEDGWLRTGDVVTVDDEGYVTIVDRKKELIISAAGKNMSPSNIENTVKAYCPLIAMAAVIGDGRPYNTALVVLDTDVATAFAAKAGINDVSAAGLAHDPGIVDMVRAGVATANTTLSRVEQVKRFRIIEAFWEPGGDEVTPTMKLKRKPINCKYADEIAALYATVPDAEVHEPGPPAPASA